MCRWEAATARGNPRFSLRVDGRPLVSSVEVPEAGGDGTSSYGFSGKWKNGLHAVEVKYLNDLHTATCDRNLYVFDVSFHGAV